MIFPFQSQKSNKPNFQEVELEGIYGKYTITQKDAIEVQNYRVAVLICGLSLSLGLGQWILFGTNWAWIWLFPLTAGLGLALQYIHIYVRVLHRTLKMFWVLGCLGIILLFYKFGIREMLPNIASNAALTILIGPFFAALTGLGFKEFFCFRRPEAIGLTALLPIALIGHLSGVFNGAIVMFLLIISAIMLVILSLRKFGMEVAADVGDKSIFNYLDNQRAAGAL